MNVGDPAWDVKESGITDVVTRPKSSNAQTGSQRGHRTRRAGKPRTGGRATPGEVASNHYAECEGLGILANVSGP